MFFSPWLYGLGIAVIFNRLKGKLKFSKLLETIVVKIIWWVVRPQFSTTGSSSKGKGFWWWICEAMENNGDAKSLKWISEWLFLLPFAIDLDAPGQRPIETHNSTGVKPTIRHISWCTYSSQAHEWRDNGSRDDRSSMLGIHWERPSSNLWAALAAVASWIEEAHWKRPSEGWAGGVRVFISRHFMLMISLII